MTEVREIKQKFNEKCEEQRRAREENDTKFSALNSELATIHEEKAKYKNESMLLAVR